MASTENPKNDGQAASSISVVDNAVDIEIIASLAWQEAPLCLLTADELRFRNLAQIRHYKLGEKIWSTDSPAAQFYLISGKVRLREEDVRQPLATLGAGG